jgi:predicted dienelactone hydrolase
MISFVDRVCSARVLTCFLGLGFAVPASAAYPSDPSTTGPWAVGHTTVVAVDAARGDRTLPVELWYPIDPENAVGDPTFYELLVVVGVSRGLTSDVAIEGAPITARQFLPLILFSHGSGGINIQSVTLMETLASHGFFVASPNHVGNSFRDVPGVDLPYADVATDRPKDISFLIDYLLSRSSDPEDEFFESISPLAIGVTGHSMGGFTALAVAAGYAGSAFGPVPPDPRVRAILAVSGVASLLSDAELAGIDVPMLLLGGTLDTSVPIVPNATRPFDLTSSTAVYRADILGATHTHFANICDIANVLFALNITIDRWPQFGAGALIAPYNQTCVPPAFPIGEAVRLQNLYTVSFFKRHLHLQESRSYAPVLTEAYADANEPGVDFFDGSGPVPPSHPAVCGLGAELALLLPFLSLAADRRRRV